jgi:transposase
VLSFAEVQVEPKAMLPPARPAVRGNGEIGIELPSGVRLTVDASVDADALSRVIGVLAR